MHASAAFFAKVSGTVSGKISAATLAAVLALSPARLLAEAPSGKAAGDSVSERAAQDSAMAGLFAEEEKLQYLTGEIKLKGDLAIVRLPPGYRYLDEVQTEKVLTEMWGNPPGSETLGMILAPDMTPLKENSWAVIIEYTEDGYVKDDDAETIDYGKLLKEMQQATEARNEDRKKMGYAPLHLVGWAEKPHYDSAAHKLHWAKELSADGDRESSLNYNIRILGRKGVLVLNAISAMSELPAVKAGLDPILAAVDFQEGHKYSQFDPKFDKVATYGISGLIAGGVLAKVGFFKMLLLGLLAAKKFLIIGFIALIAIGRRFFKKPSEQKEIQDVIRKMPEERKEETKP